MVTKTILGLANTMQSLNLISHNLKVVKKKKQTTKDMVELGVGNIVGVEMIGLNADLISTL